MKKFDQVMEIIADILEVDIAELSLETALDDGRWDSLAVITFISEVDSSFDIILSPSEVGAVKVVADLVGLVK